MPLLLGIWMLGVWAALAWAAAIDFPPTRLTIYNYAGTQLIGHSVYRLKTVAGKKIVFGENRYLDGQYDIEHDEIVPGVRGGAPRLLTFEHDYFAADGSRQITDKADFQTGAGSCTQYHDGIASVHEKHFSFPSDTYAGAAVMIPLQDDLRRGVKGPIEFHDFNCVPGPSVFTVRAFVQPAGPWRFHPGQLARVVIKPYFGWWNFAVEMFLPQFDVWFNP
ncbi:MAG: hypothetical protein ACREQ4_02450, partial [Candidatus Binataceae bacterium]